LDNQGFIVLESEVQHQHKSKAKAKAKYTVERPSDEWANGDTADDKEISDTDD
jgi:hypothetical protein